MTFPRLFSKVVWRGLLIAPPVVCRRTILLFGRTISDALMALNMSAPLCLHQQSSPCQLREILHLFWGLAFYGPLGSQTDIHPKRNFTNPIEATCLAKGRLICLYRSLTGPLRSHSFGPDRSSSVNGRICAGTSAAGGHIITSGTYNHSYLLSENIKSL